MSVDLYLNICSNEHVVLPKSRQIVILKLMMLFITCGDEYQLLISWSIEHPPVASMWCLDLSMDENGEDDDRDIRDADNIMVITMKRKKNTKKKSLPILQ